MNITHLNIKKHREALSASQKKFNRLNSRIAKLKENIESIPRKMDVVRKLHYRKIVPLQQKQCTLHYETIKRLDYMYDMMHFSARQRESLADMIDRHIENIHDLLESDDPRYEEMRELHDKYTRIVYGDEAAEQMEEESMTLFREMMQGMFGIDVEGFENLEDEEKEAFIKQKLAEKMEELQREEEERPEQRRRKQRAQKKISPQQEAKKLELDASLKTLREVYTDLVKKLHPDREKDEKLRLEKTEQMKLVTEAYEKKDLATLLLLQIKWLQNTDKDPMSQPDDILERYCNVLKMHIKKLEEEYRALFWSPMPFATCIDMYTVVQQDESSFTRYFSKFERELKQEIRELDSTFAQIHSISGLKQYLKEYEKSVDDSDMLDDIFCFN